MSKQESAEQHVKRIRRAARRQYSSEEKIRIVLEAEKKRLSGDTAREAASEELKPLRREASALKEALAETLLENRVLKKSMHGVGDDQG